jgi:hypothetical protein
MIFALYNVDKLIFSKAFERMWRKAIGVSISSQPVAKKIALVGFCVFLAERRGSQMKVNEAAKSLIASGAEPITITYEKVNFFDETDPIYRTRLLINSLDAGVLSYDQ